MHEVIEELLGETFDSVRREDYDGGDALIFENDQKSVVFYHAQDCCENVSIEDIEGSLGDLEDSPLTMAEVSSKSEETTEWGDEAEWTFYRFATIKGYVTVRWYGTSNGYYSTSVDMEIRWK